MKTNVFWNVTQCIRAEMYWCFEESCSSTIRDESTLMMEVARSSEMSVQTTRCHIPYDSNTDSHFHENVTSQKQKPISNVNDYTIFHTGYYTI